MLDPHPRAQLCFVIKQYGQVIITEPKRCKGMLSDLAPHHRLEINLLIAALEQKVAQELLKPTALIPVAMQLDRLAQRLHDTVGIKESFAYWAVESWALALNVIQQPMPKQTDQSIANVSPSPKVAVTPPPAQKQTVQSIANVSPPPKVAVTPPPAQKQTVQSIANVSPPPKVAVTPPPAQKQTLTDAWLDELITWADKNNISKYKIPRDKRAILALTTLYLYDGKLTELPESIGKLTNLTTLYLSSNQLTELPESIGKLTHLTSLYLVSNQFTELPESISKLTNLTWLDLRNNPIKSLSAQHSHLSRITKF
ncbi:hypothetical protein BCS42_13345 [Crenothrix sp. D3]|nr:hypothetical protein BCS42_13345 [Crenothrix sp. D3]